ncbi:MAG TPA: hypothetical protein VI479_01315 [Blastocatellia bacterium]
MNLQRFDMSVQACQYLRASFMAALVLMSGCAFQNKRPPYSDPDRLVSVVRLDQLRERRSQEPNVLEMKINKPVNTPVKTGKEK